MKHETGIEADQPVKPGVILLRRPLARTAEDDGVDHVAPFEDLPGSGPIVVVVLGVFSLAGCGLYWIISKLVGVLF